LTGAEPRRPPGAPTEAPLGLYIHVPFCEAKCTYCHFAIDPRRPDGERQERYVRAVLREMEAAEAGSSDTLYFGGGTPSLLEAERLGRLVEAARARFALDAGAEVTVEANPRDLDEAGYRRLRATGANRLSLGVQSFDDEVLAEMGRHHAAADSERAVAFARRAGFSNVSVDLVLGWPGETRQRWHRGLDRVLALEPDHLSLYVLEVEGKTVLSHRQRQGRLDLPEDDLVADLYLETIERLRDRGLARYEISNFARAGFASRHNAKYWDESPFLGFGMAAHSFRGRRRSWNLDRLALYCRAIETTGAAVAGERVLDHREAAQEALFTGLRRAEGVDVETFRRRHDLDPREEWAAGLEEAEAAGLVETRKGWLRLTDRGVLVSNEVFRLFV
jgi:oxygen-independent coproporphyrinogen-3 oxidase